jgi:glucose dehydrogenase
MARSLGAFLSFLTLILLVSMVETLSVWGQVSKSELSVGAKPGEWRYLNSDPMSTRYAPLDQINKDNFKDLKLAWRWKPPIGPAPSSLGGTAQGNGDPKLAIYKSEATPIMAHGVLFTAAGGPPSMQRPVDNCGCGQEWTKVAATGKRRGEMQGAASLTGRMARKSGFSS